MSQSNVSESKNRRKEHLIIKFTDLADRDVQKNDLINDSDYGSGTVYGEKDYLEQFEKSAFRYIYSQAFSQVHQIVMQSKNNNDSKGRQKKEIFDIDNTIAFTGRKGTGKTSAMLSFANFLDRHPLRIEDNGNETHDVKFVKICEIDVSYFRSNNDIFVQFLSEIADTLNQRIQEEKYNFNNSQLEQTKMLRERVHKILSDYLSISANDSLNDYDSSYSFMKKIADRQKVEKEFANFMKEFQKWYLSDKQYYGEIYFIVCIDDVDMSSNPEEIVAAIHKYFMVPQLIVFMTAETDALTSEVQKQFYDRLCPVEDKGRQERMSMRQTRDYLSKILPTDNRITMPSWKKKEYMELFPYYVTFGKNDKDKLDELKKQYPKLITDESEFYKFLVTVQSC